MNEYTVDEEQVGRYHVRVVVDDSMAGTGYYLSRDCETFGRISVPAGDKWYFQDDAASYRDIREEVGAPIVAIPLDIIDGSWTIVRVSSSWDGADAFYWAPLASAEEWAGDVAAMRARMVAEIEELAAELAGEVYGYVVTGPDGEVVDSCWGYVGDEKYAMAEGVDMARWYNYHDACKWAALPEWVKETVLIREEVAAA